MVSVLIQPQRWDDALRVGLLVLFFATWNLPIAFQQTALGCLLAFLGYTLWRTRSLPRTPLWWPFFVFFCRPPGLNRFES